ncbi:MAG: dephospho-CoA kinase [Candidatus Adiutrix sp.]|jgi:dephospho-CoA kinase|nr:dephospho-CoA kinase [Candidatus Adiutrix sp.]
MDADQTRETDENQIERPAEPPAWALARPELLERLSSRPGRLRLALTGGAASGKSRVAGFLETLGARHVDLDDLAREISAPGQAGFNAVLELFGQAFLSPDGVLDRAKIGRAVFAEPEARRKLEDALHPLIWELLDLKMAALAEEPAVALSVPLLFETGLDALFHPIVMVFASPAVQTARLLARQPLLSPEEAGRILEAQWPAAPKIKGSDFIINNDGGWAETESQLRALWPRLLDGRLGQG